MEVIRPRNKEENNSLHLSGRSSFKEKKNNFRRRSRLRVRRLAKPLRQKLELIQEKELQRFGSQYFIVNIELPKLKK